MKPRKGAGPPGLEVMYRITRRPRFSYQTYKTLVRERRREERGFREWERERSSPPPPIALARPPQAHPLLTPSHSPMHTQALVLTFFAYFMYHATRKPPSIVKRCATTTTAARHDRAGGGSNPRGANRELTPPPPHLNLLHPKQTKKPTASSKATATQGLDGHPLMLKEAPPSWGKSTWPSSPPTPQACFSQATPPTAPTCASS